MEVILLEYIRNLGKVGEVVKVRDGYGRNFLLKTGKALRADEENKAIFKKWDWFTLFLDTLWGGILFSLSVYLFRLF